jgi:hypothetical protein
MNQISHHLQATNITEKTATTRLAIPVIPILNLIAALVFEGLAPVDDFDPLTPPAVADALLEVGVDFGGREILLKVIVEAPGIGTVTDALGP